jgi:ppGpp synthetase/RelA/SpoT-type nucleotidyltranferase
MHVEKGVFESTIGLLLDIACKTKDGLNAHKDLHVLRIREELHPQERLNGKIFLPPARYTLTNEEKREICKCLCGIRVPTGFSTNIKNLVSMSELKEILHQPT